jgi:hypothetical protein
MKFPDGLRMARRGDEDRLFALFAVAHAENGYGEMDAAKVREVIARGCVGDRVVIALAEGPERIEAAIGLHPQRQWYASDELSNYYNTDLLIYVHPLHRRSRHATRLFRFAQWWERESKMPVILGLMPKDDLTGKEKLFQRFGRKIGASFMIGGDATWPNQIGTA